MMLCTIRNQALKDELNKTYLKEINALINRTRVEQRS